MTAIDDARQFARYLESWTDEQDSEVTTHEIASMRQAGRELHGFLDAMQVAQTAIVRPGDTLILRVTDRTPREYIDRCGEALREKLPNVEVLFVGGVEEMAVYRPEPRYEVTVDADVTSEQAARFAEEMSRRVSSTSSWRRG